MLKRKSTTQTVNEVVGRQFTTQITPDTQKNPENPLRPASTLSIFVKIKETDETIYCRVPANSTVHQLKEHIFEQATIPEDSRAILLHQSKDIANDLRTLKARGIRSYETLTLTGASLLLGGMRINTEDSNADNDYQKARNVESGPTSKVNPSDGKASQKMPIHLEDEADKLMRTASELYGQAEHDGLGHEWANIIGHVKDMLQNPLEATLEMFSMSKAVNEVRKQLVDSYGVPELNEGLSGISEILPILRKKMESIQNDLPPQALNNSIVQMANQFKSKEANHLTSSEMSSLMKALCKELELPITEPQLENFIKAIDRDGDGRFDLHEIVRPFSKEERKAYFEQKRNEIKAKWKEQQKKEAKENQDDEEANDAGKKEGASQKDSDGEMDEDFMEENDWEQYNEEKEKELDEGCDEHGRFSEDEVYGEDFFQYLFRVSDKHQNTIKRFEEKMSEDIGVKDLLDTLISNLAVREPWYEKLNLQQKDLLKAILTKALLTDDGFKSVGQSYQWGWMEWDEINRYLDDKTVLHLIFAFSPDVYKQSVIVGGLNTQSKIYFDIIENARSSKMLNILIDKVEKQPVGSKNTEQIQEEFESFFKDANLPQRRLLLTMTNSQSLKAIWLENLTASEVLNVARPTATQKTIEFSLLALCSNEKLAEIMSKLSEKEAQQFDVWKQRNAMGLPHDSLSDLEAAQSEQLSIHLPTDTKYLMQIPHPGLPGEFLRIEKQSNNHLASFKMEDQDEICKNKDPETGYVLVQLRYSKKSNHIETYSQRAIEQPISIKSGSLNSFTRPVLFTGQSKEVFWFSKNALGRFNINILDLVSDYVSQTQINKDSQLHDYLANETPCSSGEYGDLESCALAEPTIVSLAGQLSVIYSYFRLGGKPSVCFYSLVLNRDMLQISGANMFMHLFEEDGQESERQDQVSLILYADPDFCCKQFETIQDLENMEAGGSVTKCIFKRFTLNISKYYDGDEKAVFDFMQDYESYQEKYSAIDQDVLIETLPADDSDWIQVHEAHYISDEKAFKTPGSFKVVNHVGKDGRKFFALQNTLEKNAMFFVLFEVLGANKLKRVELGSQVQENEGCIFLVSQEPNTDPILMLYDYEKEMLQQVDVLNMESQAEEAKSKSENSGDDSEMSDEKEKDNALNTVILPEEYTQKLEQDEVKLFAQPYLADGVLVTSCSDMSGIWADIVIQQPTDVSKKKNIDDEDQTDKAKLTLYEPNSPESWNVKQNYPIIACANKNRSGELTIAHLANLTDEQLQIKFDFGQFISFVEMESEASTKVFGLLGYDAKKKTTTLYKLAHSNETYQKNSLFRARNWRFKSTELKGKYEKLFHLKDSIKSVQFLKDKNDDDINGLLVQTQQEVLFVTEKAIQVVFEQKGDLVMYHPNIIHTQSGKNFFVTEEVSSQTNSIQEITVKIEAITKSFKITCKPVYTFSTGQIVEIQLNRDTEQQQASNYAWGDSRGQFQNDEAQTQPDCITDLMVIDTSFNFIKLQQFEAEQPFVEIFNRSLSKGDHVRSLVAQKTAEHNIVISERSLTFRGNVFALDTDIQFNALQNDKEVIANQVVPKSDKIMFTVKNRSSLELVFKRDAGRRNCDPVGHDELKDCVSTSVISKDLMLLQIRNRSGTYWTYITQSGSIKAMPEKVHNLLYGSDDDEQGKIYNMVENRIIKGNVCQLLCIKQTVCEDDECYLEKDDPDDEDGLVIEVSSKGDYLRHKELALRNPAITMDNAAIREAKMFPKDDDTETRCCKDVRFLLNQEGKLLELFILLESDKTLNEPKILSTQKISVDQLSPIQVVFPHPGWTNQDNSKIVKIPATHTGFSATNFVYAGNYLCWVLPNENEIRALDISGQDGKGKTKIIKFDDFRGETEAHLIGLSACSAQNSLRMWQSNKYNYDTLSYASNCIQLTLHTHALLFDLNKEEPVPITEIAAMHQLDDPQNFIDCGMSLETIQEKTSMTWTHNETLQVKKGHKYGLRRWYETQPHGNLVLIKQASNLPFYKTHETDLWYRPVLGFYKNFCEVDIMQLKHLIHCAQSGVKPKKIDIKALWAKYGDDILLSHLKGNLRVLTAIKEMIESLELECLEDNDGLETTNPDLRRLSTILLSKTYLEKNDDGTESELQSYLTRNMNNSGLRDAILKIGRLSPNFSVFKTFSNQEAFDQMIKNSTPQTTAELENCFTETRTTRQIQLLDWPRDLGLLTIRSKKCTITKEEFDVELEEHENRVTRAVNVTTLNLSFFFRERKNFIAFTQMLQGLPNQVYASIFVESILDQFWEATQYDIIKFKFVPYLCFVVSTLWFFVVALSPRQTEGEEYTSHFPDWQIQLQGGITFLFWCHNVVNECYQISALENKLSYFTDMWNMNDFISLAFTIIIIATSVEHNTVIAVENLRAMAAIASCTLMIKVFDWLRLFENTAFYILLVQETMKDIKAFLILLMTTLMMFGIPMIMLDLNRTEENALVESTFGFWGFNLLLNQYLLALGEFNMDNFADQPHMILCFFFFISATFITQITMLNMLIAIMGDTFERVMENKDVNATQTKLELMSDLVASLQQTSSIQEEKVYLFVARPDDDDGDAGDDWEGTVNKMTRITAGHIKNLGLQLHKKNDKLQDSIDDFVKKDQTQDKHLKAHIDKVVKSMGREVFGKIETSLSAIMQKLDEKKEASAE